MDAPQQTLRAELARREMEVRPQSPLPAPLAAPGGIMPRHEPYDWQRDVARLVAQQNVILNAETGSGKTKVAILAIDDARRRFPGKKCVFLTPTRILAHQQYTKVVDECEEVRPERVGEVTGYTAGKWGSEEWEEGLRRYDVLVGTPAEFRKSIIDHGFWGTASCSLIIFDECHHASGKDEMAQILRHLHKNGRSPTTRVLGLTGSFSRGAQQASGTAALERDRRDLEGLLCAQMVSPAIPKPSEPTFEKVSYAAPPTELGSDGLRAELVRSLSEAGVTDATKLGASLAKVAAELGREAFVIAATKGLLAQVAAQIDEAQRMTATQDRVPKLQQLEQCLRRFVEQGVDSAAIHQELQAFGARSGKLQRLEELVDNMLRTGTDSGIVFVQEVALALPLAAILSQRFRPAGGEEGGAIVGVATGTGSMLEQERNKAFAHFKRGHTRILVTTPCSEEGVDISTCAFVVSFSEYATTKSHIQRAGRARKAGAKIYLFENDPAAESERAARMQAVARDPGLRQSPEALDSLARAQSAHLHLPGRHPFVPPGSAAVVSFANAGRIFADYCAKVTRGSAGRAEALLVRNEAGDVAALAVPGPGGGCLLPAAAVDRFFGDAALQEKDEVKLHYVAVLLLHARGWLTEHNTPSDEAVLETVWPETGGVGARPLHLQLADYSREVLGEVTQPLAMSELMPNDLGGGRRDREYREPTQQVTLGTLLLDPAVIRNTQRTVNKTFSKGGSVLRAMMDIVQGMTSPDEFPPIRVAHGPPNSADDDRHHYSADNRRVFTYKVVAPLCGLQEVKVQLINWTVEFDGKLRQEPRVGDTWTTTDSSILEVREMLRRALEAEERGDEALLAQLLGETPGGRDTPGLDDSDFDDEDEPGCADGDAGAAANAMLASLGAALGGAPQPALPPHVVERLRAAAAGRGAGTSPDRGPGGVEAGGAPAAPHGDPWLAEAVEAVAKAVNHTGLDSAWTSALASALQHAAESSAAVRQVLQAHGWVGGQFKSPPDRRALLEDLKGSDPGPAGPAAASGLLPRREAGLPLGLRGREFAWVGVGLPPERSGLPRDHSLGAGGASVASGVRPPVQQPPEPPPPPRPDDEEERIFQHLCNIVANERLQPHHLRDAVTTINLMIQKLHRPHTGERRPLEYSEAVAHAGGWVVALNLCGRVFRGQPERRNIDAKQEAARAALRALAEGGDGDATGGIDSTGGAVPAPHRPAGAGGGAAGEAAAALDELAGAAADGGPTEAEVVGSHQELDVRDDVHLQVRVQMPDGDVRTSDHLHTETVGQVLAPMGLPPLELIEVLCRGVVVDAAVPLADLHAWAGGDVLLELRMADQW